MINTTRRNRQRRGLALLLSLWLAAGCGPSPKPAQPEAARQTLQALLEAWKGGSTPEAFAKKSSSHVADSRWAGGYKLLEYEIAPSEEVHGYDLNFQVTLRLEDARGNKVREKTIYRVATSPRLVVLRAEEL